MTAIFGGLAIARELMSCCLAGRLGRGEGWHACGKIIKPGDQARMVGPPAFAETKIAVAERAGERNLSDIRQAGGRGFECRRTRLEHSERARHFAGLMIEPFLLVTLGRAPTRLVHRENRSV